MVDLPANLVGFMDKCGLIRHTWTSWLMIHGQVDDHDHSSATMIILMNHEQKWLVVIIPLPAIIRHTNHKKKNNTKQVKSLYIFQEMSTMM